MKNNTKLACIATLIATTFGCSDSAVQEEQPVMTNTQDIVINTRNVQQTRGALIRAEFSYHIDQDLVSARKEYMLNSLAQASPTIRVWKNAIDEGEYGKCGVGLVELSSGVMTSDSRLMGSAHALFGATNRTATPPQITDEIKYRVSFGGIAPDLLDSPVGMSGTSSPQWNQSGNFIPDINSGTNWIDDYDPSFYDSPEEDGFGFSEKEEENPILANRLFSLGLEAWAEFGNREVRNRLRSGWPFTIDHDSTSADEYEQFESQGMAEVYGSGDHWKGFDVAFLKAMEHDHLEITNNPGSLGYLPSGPFALNRPSIFFNQIDLQEGVEVNPQVPYEDADTIYKVLHGEPLHLLHSRSWTREFKLSGVLNNTTLISYPGFRHYDYVDLPFWISNPHDHRDLVQRPVSCRVGNSTASRFRSFSNSIFFHTLDSGPGSSGGTVLAGRLLDEKGQRSKWFLEGVGVHSGSGVKSTGSAIGGWEPFILPNDEDIPWLVEGSPFSNTQFGMLWGTWLNPQALSYGRRDHPGGGTVNNPQPDEGSANSPGDISYPNTGASYNEQVEGRGWSALDQDRHSNVIRTPWSADVGNFDEQFQWSETSMDGSNPPGGTFKGHEYDGYYELEYHCDNDDRNTSYDSPYAGHKGYLIGAIGARTYKGEMDGLTSYGSVCSPWSNKSWSDNWRFLGVTTTPWLEFEIQRARGIWPDYLVNLLKRAFYTLENETSEFALKPIALKTCPPNYAVSQVQFELNVEAEMPYITSVEAFKCTPINSDVYGGGHELMTVYTNPQSKHDGYTIDGIPFNLRQDIGIVNPVHKTYEKETVWVGCAPNQVMVSLAMQISTLASTEGMFIGANPGCRNKP